MLDLVRDLESGISQWTMQPGVYDEWFPKPALAPTDTDTSPLPLPGYPAPIENAKPTSPEIAYPYP